MIYLQLFLSFFQVGLFSFGGGMAAIPLIQSQVVEAHKWLNITEFTDLITIAEMTPGPIAVNSATFVGIRVAGMPGAIIATLGCIIPSCIIVSLLAWLYNKYKDFVVIQGILSGLRPAIVALIASAGVTILILSLFGEGGLDRGIKSIDLISFAIFCIGVLALKKCKLNPMKVMLGSGVVGGMIYLVLGAV